MKPRRQQELEAMAKRRRLWLDTSGDPRADTIENIAQYVEDQELQRTHRQIAEGIRRRDWE